MPERAAVIGLVGRSTAVLLALALSAPIASPRLSAAGANRPPRHVALLIGIGDYRHLGREPNDQGVADLRGPPNDLARMRKSLEAWGFRRSEDVRVLRDSAATRDRIAEGFRWAADRATEREDVVVIYFSGHGSNAPDLDGDESDPLRAGVAGDEYDEGLVPFDAVDIHEPSQLVLDDSIHVWLQRLGTENVTLIVDACYSGTVSRGPAEGSPIGQARGPVGTGGSGSTMEGFAPGGGHVLLTAASSTDRAWELPLDAEGRVYGVMTYHLTRILDGATRKAAPAQTRYEDLLGWLKTAMRSEVRFSVPELRGRAGDRLFRIGSDAVRPASGRVDRLSEGRYGLDQGAVHGVRPNSAFDLFDPGDEELAGPVLGSLIVQEVAETTAVGLLLEGSGDVPSGTRALPVSAPVGAGRLDSLRIYTDPELGAVPHSSLVDLFARSGAPMTRVDRRELADVSLLPAGNNVAVEVNGVRLPRTGETRHDFPPTADALCSPLVRALGITRFDLLDNPQALPFYAVELRVVPQGSVPDPHAPRVFEDTAVIGRAYDIYVRVHSPVPLHISIAVEGYTEEPWQLYPAGIATPAIPSDGRWQLLPRGPSAVYSGIRPGPPAGLERLKIVAGEAPYELGQLISALPDCQLRGGGEARLSAASLNTRWITSSHTLRFVEK